MSGKPATLLLTASICLCFYGTTSAAAEPVQPISVERLIEQLGNPDFHTREEAGQQILRQGPGALPALLKNRKTADAEVRRRVEELIVKLERATVLAPNYVSLHLRQKPIADALAQIAKQTGYTIPLEGAIGIRARDTLGTFEFDKLTFWEAFDRVCHAGGLSLMQSDGDNTLRLTAQDAYTPFVSYDGTFKITATGFHYSLTSNFGQLARNGAPSFMSYESLQFNFMVAVEPRLPIMHLGQVRLSAAEDDEGHSMLLGNGGPNGFFQGGARFYRGGMQRTYFQSANIGLAWPSKSAHTVKLLRGTVPVTLLAEQKPILLTDQVADAKGKTLRAGTASFQISEVSKSANNQMQIKITYNDEGLNNPFDYSQVQMVPGRVELQDNKGKKIRTNGYIQMYHSPSSIDFLVRTAGMSSKDVGAPTRLVFQHFVQMEHEVPFELKGLPLP
jgi:hypothetical protein